MFALLLFACIDGRDPVDVPVSFLGSEARYVLDDHTVEFSHAVAHISDIRLLGAPEDEPVVWNTPYPLVAALLPTAVAHPGHEFAGDVRGELLGDYALDLIGTEHTLGLAEAYEGDVATARVQLDAVELAGTVSTSSGDMSFDVVLEVGRPITGITVGSDLASGLPSDHQLSVTLADVVALVEWDDTNGDGELGLDDEILYNTLLFGITTTTAWHIRPVGL